MSETPRTDSAVDHYYYNKGGNARTLILLSQELETELSTAQSELASLREAVKRRDGVIEKIAKVLPRNLNAGHKVGKISEILCVSAKLKEGAK